MKYHVVATRGLRNVVVGTYAQKSYAYGRAFSYKRANPGYRVGVYTTKLTIETSATRVLVK